ncbi:STAS domain-containing protein [Nonomuraea sp. NPDC001831]|uniref:STAS domain-containing protein n=1 Tax=Nonomuraea sp. NPDC001831 TaxID=3364340 RepID=UPI00367D77B4
MITVASDAVPPAPLPLTSRLVDDIAVITISVLLDATTRDQFADYLAQAGPALILDLGGVTFMDSRARDQSCTTGSAPSRPRRSSR